MKPRITVVGSSNTDMVIRCERIPAPGETIIGGQFSMVPGGKGANQAVAAARAGGDVTFVARVGCDVFGTEAVQNFERDGIRVEYVSRDADSPSGVALIFVGNNGENSIAVASGANANLTPSLLEGAKPAIRDSRVLLTQLETPLESVIAAVETACLAEVPVILNPAPARQLPHTLLSKVSILTPNETEAELLTGIRVLDQASAADAASKLLGRGVRTVIVTLGPRGALLAQGSDRKLIDGFKVTPVDTTAAGDIFNGSLAVALAEGRPLPEAVHFACAAAAISVTRRGAQPSAPWRNEIDAFLKTA